MISFGLGFTLCVRNMRNKINKLNIRRYSAISNTIYALSSGQGRCGVAVIRVSGPEAAITVKKIGQLQSLPEPRRAVLRRLRNPDTHEILDRGLILWFPGPHSFTGEDACEFHVHGGPAVVTAILNALNKIPGTRPADPGEFTRRAFHSGKLDLTEVEGLADLLQAETEAQRKQALLQSEGTLSKLYSSWRNLLLRNLAHLEAHIDFEEDENLDDGMLDDIVSNIRQLSNEIRNHLADGRKGERLRTGARTIILGEPNVGKSSLLNSLCQRPAAIVTSTAGTTRDILESVLDLGGYPVVLIDTAGLRKDTQDIIEKEGIKRAVSNARHSDFIVLMIDATKYVEWKNCYNKQSFSDYLNYYLSQTDLTEVLEISEDFSQNEMHLKSNFGQLCMIIINKIDLLEETDQLMISKVVDEHSKFVTTVSCKTEEGFSLMIGKMVEHLKLLCGVPSRESPVISQIRHRQQLQACLEALQTFLEQTCSSELNTSVQNRNFDVALAAQSLRTAMRNLGKITGHVTTEQLLDVIFRDFCIGK